MNGGDISLFRWWRRASRFIVRSTMGSSTSWMWYIFCALWVLSSSGTSIGRVVNLGSDRINSSRLINAVLRHEQTRCYQSTWYIQKNRKSGTYALIPVIRVSSAFSLCRLLVPGKFKIKADDPWNTRRIACLNSTPSAEVWSSPGTSSFQF